MTDFNQRRVECKLVQRALAYAPGAFALLPGLDRQLGVSPVQGQTMAEFVAILRANTPLLATAQNYWLYTNRHLKLIGELRADAERLAAHLENADGGNR
jgi:hypothetical protein